MFRVGDFYETFSEDAIKASKILGIVLTQRKNGSASSVELAGFPHHSLDAYLPKLVRAGERVAICDQLEDPKMTKTIVKRGVTELVTPGVSFSDKVLDHNKNNFLASLFFDDKEHGAAFLDVSTGEFFIAEGKLDYIEKLVMSFSPSEIVYERKKQGLYQENFGKKFYTYCLEDWAYNREFGYDLLLRQFGTHSLKGFGVEDLPKGIIAAGAAVHYLGETQHERLKHLNRLTRINEADHVWLDGFTMRNLELFHAAGHSGKALIDVLDNTITPMGARLLKQWLAFPLNDLESIENRLRIVGHFKENDNQASQLRDLIKNAGDLERMVSRIAIGKITPKELNQVARALEQVQPLREQLKATGMEDLTKIAGELMDCRDLATHLRKWLHPDAPVNVQRGNAINNGVNEDLDELRYLCHSSKDILVQMQQREMQQTGISSLKVGFNNVFGYYLEVTHAHKAKVPEAWIRKQTLVNAERYITEELKEYEGKILGAEEKIQALEQQLYLELLTYLTDFIAPLQRTSQVLAKLDCLLNFAHIAGKSGYNRPEIHQGLSLDIEEGRHPMIEQEIPLGESYVPNGTHLDDQNQQIIMLTGPNMAGKSALLRQTALIVLMAQIGSFVPAKAAKIGLVDRIFTRVGASDNISQGESTFMVEMNETASILNNLSKRSLVLLDEIGRGTSTYDGISIAWAITEFLHRHPHRPRTLFATHYHELNEMAKSFERIKNFTIAIRETDNKIIFLRKLIPGGSEHSFGIHVAKMAGMPQTLIQRAYEVLKELENSHRQTDNTAKLGSLGHEQVQLSFFQLDDPVLSQIKDELVHIDINALTPVEALFKLNEIKKLIGKG